MKMQTSTIKIILLTLACVGVCIFAEPVYAAQITATDVGVNAGDATGLGTQDIRVTIANVIRAGLALVGVVLLGLVIYAGILWMTAGDPVVGGGDTADRINRAKQILRSAAIGLLIILISFAVVTWIINAFLSATGDGTVTPGSGPGQCTPSGCYACDAQGTQVWDEALCGLQQCDPDPTGIPKVCSIDPERGPVGTFITLRGHDFGIKNADSAVSMVASFGGEKIPLSLAQCSTGIQWSDKQIIVEVQDTSNQNRLLEGQTYSVVVDTSTGENDQFSQNRSRFTLTNDPLGPALICVNPSEGKSGDSVIVEGRRLGQSTFTFAGSSARIPASATNLQSAFVINGTDVYRVEIPVGAVSSRDGIRAESQIGNSNALAMNIIPSAQSCDVDGNSANQCQVNPAACGAGAFCSTDSCTCQTGGQVGDPCSSVANSCSPDSTRCAAGNYCSADSCTCQAQTDDPNQPAISDITPRSGSYESSVGTGGVEKLVGGDFVTILGNGFGDEPGRVYFSADGTTGSQRIEAIGPQQCGTIDWWKANAITVEVPLHAGDGPITVETSSAKTAVSNATSPDLVFDVIPDGTLRAGLCSVTPDSGSPGSTFTLSGVRFGAASAGSNRPTGTDVLFGSATAADYADTSFIWTESADQNTLSEIRNIRVPQSLAEQKTQISIRKQVGTSSLFSNALPFTVGGVQQSGGIPRITSIAPVSGPVGTYLRIAGSNFGTTRGRVVFITSTNNRVEGDFNLPPACTNALWSDTGILVRVPAGLSPESAQVEVVLPNAVTSNRRSFTVTDEPLKPQVCELSPNNGPVGLRVQIFGEGFGDQVGSVLFDGTTEARQIAGQSWNAGQVGIEVPSVAAGDHDTTVTRTSDGITSDPARFTVQDCRQGDACAAGTQCCADGSCRLSCGGVSSQYVWRFVAGDTGPRVTSTSPAAQALVYAADVELISLTFDTPVNENSLRAQGANAGVIMRRCVSSSVNVGTFSCPGDVWENVVSSGTVEQKITVTNGGRTDVMGISLKANTLSKVEDGLIQAGLYQVIVRDTVQNPNGFGLRGGNFAYNGGLPDDYMWTFQVVPLTTACISGECFSLPAPTNLNVNRGALGATSVNVTWRLPVYADQLRTNTVISYVDANNPSAAPTRIVVPEGALSVEIAGLTPDTSYNFTASTIEVSSRLGSSDDRTTFTYNGPIDAVPQSDSTPIFPYSTLQCDVASQCGATDFCCSANSCLAYTNSACAVPAQDTVVGCQDSNTSLSIQSGQDQSCSTVSAATPCCVDTTNDNVANGSCQAISYDNRGAVTCSAAATLTSNPAPFMVYPGQSVCDTCLVSVQNVEGDLLTNQNFNTPRGTFLDQFRYVGYNFNTQQANDSAVIGPLANRLALSGQVWVNGGTNASVADSITGRIQVDTITGDAVVQKFVTPVGQPAGRMCVSNPLPVTINQPERAAVDFNASCDVPNGSVSVPSPYPGQRDICVNAQVRIAFTQPVRAAANANTTAIITRCQDVIETTVDGRVTYQEVGCSTNEPGSVAFSSDKRELTFTPTASALQQNQWYRVEVRQNEVVDDQFGAPLQQTYAWYFKTRPSSQGCAYDAVLARPASKTFTVVGEKDDFTGRPYGQQCQSLRTTETPNWSWGLDNALVVEIPSGPVTVDGTLYPSNPFNSTGYDGAPLSTVVVQANQETTSSNVVKLKANYLPGSTQASGTSDIFVRLGRMSVVQTWPQPRCTNACTNAFVGVEFDRALANTSDQLLQAARESVMLFKKSDWNANSISANNNLVDTASAGGLVVSNGGRELQLIPRQGLQANTQYVAAIRMDAQGLRSATGEPLSDSLAFVTKRITGYSSGVNPTPPTVDAKWYVWEFTTAANACQVDAVDVLPPVSDLWVGDEQQFNAQMLTNAYCAISAVNGTSVTTSASQQRIVAPIGALQSWKVVPENIAVSGAASACVNAATSDKLGFKSSVTNGLQVTGIAQQSTDPSYPGVGLCVTYTDANHPATSPLRDMGIVSINYCTTDLQCEQGGQCGGSQCVNNRCTPVIKDIDPEDGAPGTWITIRGCYFGAQKGDVQFGVADKQQEGVSALWPIDSNPICTTDWTQDTIVAQVPFGNVAMQYTFDQQPAAGGVPAQQTAALRDSSPMRNDARAIGVTLPLPPGRFGAGLRLGGADDLALATPVFRSGTSTGLVPGDRPFSMQFWLKLDDNDANREATLVKTDNWRLDLVRMASLIGEYPFDGADAAAVGRDLRPQAVDAGDNKLINSNAGISQVGRFAQALQFSAGQSAELSGTGSLSLDSSTSSFTNNGDVAIEFWMKNTEQQEQVIMSQQSPATGNSNSQWQIVQTASGALEWRQQYTLNGQTGTLRFPTTQAIGPVNDGAWKHVLIQVRRSTCKSPLDSQLLCNPVPTITWVVNGAFAGTTTFSQALPTNAAEYTQVMNQLRIPNASSNIKLGATAGSSVSGYVGLLDELRIYRIKPLAYNNAFATPDSAFGAFLPNPRVYAANAERPTYLSTDALLQLIVTNPTGSGVDEYLAVSPLPQTALDPDTWYHIAIVRPIANQMQLYLNGQPISTMSWAGATTFLGTGDMRIGKGIDGRSNPIGVIDDIKYYEGYARTQLQIYSDASQQ